jgi:hypothetical protein
MTQWTVEMTKSTVEVTRKTVEMRLQVHPPLFFIELAPQMCFMDESFFQRNQISSAKEFCNSEGGAV